MKKYLILISLIAFLTNSTIANPAKEIKKVEQVLKDYYSAVEKFDYKAIPTFCTADFTGFEEGSKYTKIDDFVTALKNYEGAFDKINLDFIKTEVLGDVAFTVVEVEVNLSKEQNKKIGNAYETYILKKTDKKWLIHYYHVSHLNTPNNNQ